MVATMQAPMASRDLTLTERARLRQKGLQCSAAALRLQNAKAAMKQRDAALAPSLNLAYAAGVPVCSLVIATGLSQSHVIRLIDKGLWKRLASRDL